MDPRSEYREAATRGATRVGLVILLYEQAVQDLRRALFALEQGDVELRTQAINHALLIINHLQGTLDRERGGEASRHLDRFYNCTRAQLTEAQMQMSHEILREQISALLSLREAWVQVDSAARAEALTPPVDLPKDPTAGTSVDPVATDWTG